MLKLTSVFLFVVMFTTGTMHAQILPDQPKPKETRADLRQVFSKETKKLNSESSAIDLKKMDKIRRQVPKNNWSNMKTAVVLIVVAFAIIIVLGIKYTKRCIRRDPPGCDFTDTTSRCECLEYARDDDEARRPR